MPRTNPNNPAVRRWGAYALYPSATDAPGVWRWSVRLSRAANLTVRTMSCTVAEVDEHIATHRPPTSDARAAELALGRLRLDDQGRILARADRVYIRAACEAVGLRLEGRHIVADPDVWEGATVGEVLAYFRVGA